MHWVCLSDNERWTQNIALCGKGCFLRQVGTHSLRCHESLLLFLAKVLREAVREGDAHAVYKAWWCTRRDSVSR